MMLKQWPNKDFKLSLSVFLDGEFLSLDEEKTSSLIFMIDELPILVDRLTGGFNPSE